MLKKPWKYFHFAVRSAWAFALPFSAKLHRLHLWCFSTAWYDSARHGSEQHSSVGLGLRFHCSLVPLWSGRDYSRVVIVAPPQLPWLLKNVLILRSSIKLSLDPLLGYQREKRLYFLNRQRNKFFWLLKERCAHSKQLRSILCWLGWFKSSGSWFGIACQTDGAWWNRSTISWRNSNVEF